MQASLEITVFADDNAQGVLRENSEILNLVKRRCRV